MVRQDEGHPNGPGGRRWYQSIAAKLQIAFGLIVALTVGAADLALERLCYGGAPIASTLTALPLQPRRRSTSPASARVSA